MAYCRGVSEAISDSKLDSNRAFAIDTIADYANSMGLDKVLEKLRHYQTVSGDDFWAPSALLVSLVEKGERFK